MAETNQLADLASRAVGGSVMYANDEFFVEKEHLIKPEAPVSCKGQSSARGGVYDGWETRRRRTPGHDWVLVRLASSAVISSIVVDTSFFRGNYPDAVSVQACSMPGYPSTEELLSEKTEWADILPQTPCEGDAENHYPITDTGSFTHVRLNIHPDGGVARLRVLGEPVADPLDHAGLSLDLAALVNGACVTDQSDNFFNPASNVILPGLPRTTKEGWETKRRRTEGHDWLIIRLAAVGIITQIGLDTSRYIGNSPHEFQVFAADERTGDLADADSWWPILEKTRVSPDILQRYRTHSQRPATHVRLEIHPDGGLARLHLNGHLSDQGACDLALRWVNTIGEQHLRKALLAHGVSTEGADQIAQRRPFESPDEITAALGTDDAARVLNRLALPESGTIDEAQRQ